MATFVNGIFLLQISIRIAKVYSFHSDSQRMIYINHINVSKYPLFVCLLLSFFIASAQEVDRQQLLRDIQYLSSDELGGRKPLTEGNQLAAQFIRDRFKSLGLTSQFKSYTQRFPLMGNRGNGEALGEGTNITAFIPGQDSDRLIVITAHYDHLGTTEAGAIFNGADDNASGTAALLALAEYFTKNKPRASIILAALDAEEMGLQGAKALVRDFPFSLEHVLVNVNMDMISRNVKSELYAAGTLHYPHLKPALENAAKGAKVTLKFGHDEPGIGADDWTKASDHAAFHDKGVPFVYFGVEDHPDYHKETDTFENIDPEFYYEAVRLIIRCVEKLDEALIP